MRNLTHALLLLLLLTIGSSCQKVAIDEIEEGKNSNENTVTAKFRISQLEQIPFDALQNSKVRAADIKQACSHLFFAVYTTSGDRKTYKSQNSTDSDFGIFSLSLEKGTYRFVALAYNSNYNPTNSTDPTKINFGNNGKMSDTFLWSGDVTIDDNIEKDIVLKRAVAAFRLVTTDNIPDNVAKINFRYTGGSSTLNAITGKGNANSKQDETFTVNETGKPATFTVFTFPKDDANVLKMQITALDTNGNTVASRNFDDVPITRNKVTEYKGLLFGKTGGNNTEGTDSQSLRLSVSEAWDGIIEKSF